MRFVGDLIFKPISRHVPGFSQVLECCRKHLDDWDVRCDNGCYGPEDKWYHPFLVKGVDA